MVCNRIDELRSDLLIFDALDIEKGPVARVAVANTASMAAFLAAGSPGINNTTKFAVRGLS